MVPHASGRNLARITCASLSFSRGPRWRPAFSSRAGQVAGHVPASILHARARHLSHGTGSNDGRAARSSGQGGGWGGQHQHRRQATAAVFAVSAVGVVWLTYEDRRGGLSGGPFEPLTLHVAAVSLSLTTTMRHSRGSLLFCTLLLDIQNLF